MDSVKNHMMQTGKKKSWLLGFALVFLLLGVSRLPDEYIYWSSGQKLSGSDFRGRPDPASGMKAMTHSGIAYSWQCSSGNLTFEVIARFDPNKSWMRPGAETKLLEHEQKHFDITEIYARKMRKTFSEIINPCKRGAQLDEAADKIYREWDDVQNRYDEETQHGINAAEQKRWETWVAQELEALKDYAD